MKKPDELYIMIKSLEMLQEIAKISQKKQPVSEVGNQTMMMFREMIVKVFSDGHEQGVKETQNQLIKWQ